MNKNNSDDRELLTNLLRISTEPCTYIDNEQVHGYIAGNPVEYFQYVKTCLEDLAEGKASLEMAPKQIFTDHGHGGDFRVMPCVIRRNGTVSKTVKIVGTNIQQSVVPDQITVGKAFAIHPQDNFISHEFDGCLLSSARTGICAAIAIDLLAGSISRLTIIGAGRVGYYSAFYACSIANIQEVNICDIQKDRAINMANLLGRRFPGIRFNDIGSINKVNSDAIILATTSKETICSPDDLSASLVISLGADTDDQHELSEKWVNEADIFVDTLDSARFGDLNLWQQSGLISLDELVDLFSLLQDTGSEQKRRRVFVSTGSAIFDNITISYILSKLPD